MIGNDGRVYSRMRSDWVLEYVRVVEYENSMKSLYEGSPAVRSLHFSVVQLFEVLIKTLVDTIVPILPLAYDEHWNSM